MFPEPLDYDTPRGQNKLGLFFALKWTLIVSGLIAATFAVFVRLRGQPPATLTVSYSSQTAVPSAYELKVEKITALFLNCPTSRPSASDEAELFNDVLHDSDFRIRVRAMAVLPFVRDRKRAIAVLVASIHDRDPISSANGTVPLYAATYLADMDAKEAIPEVANWVDYLRKARPYGEQVGPMILKKSTEDLSRLKSASTRPQI
jgi:hypothetical protein